MKGNEARSVFYLHPKKSNQEEVTNTKPKKLPLSCQSLLLVLSTILGLGVLAFVLHKLANNKLMDKGNLMTDIGMIASSSLMLLYVGFVFAKRIELFRRIAKAWRSMHGKRTTYKKPLLHTQPYYLAISRSCCEVSPIQLFMTKSHRI